MNYSEGTRENRGAEFVFFSTSDDAAGSPSASLPPQSPSPMEEDPSPLSVVEEDPVQRAEKVKELGNISFKAARYGEAIDNYTKAIRKIF